MAQHRAKNRSSATGLKIAGACSQACTENGFVICSGNVRGPEGPAIWVRKSRRQKNAIFSDLLPRNLSDGGAGWGLSRGPRFQRWAGSQGAVPARTLQGVLSPGTKRSVSEVVPRGGQSLLQLGRASPLQFRIQRLEALRRPIQEREKDVPGARTADLR